MLMRLRLILQAIQAIKLLEFLNPIRLILKLRLIVILTILARLKPLLIRWPLLLKHLIRFKLFMWPIMIMGRISSFTLSLQHHKFS